MDQEEILVGIVAHDLRNPLWAIKMASDALLKHELASHDRALAGRISRSSDRLIRMINDLLDYTRIKNHLGIPINSQVDEMGRLVLEVFHEFQYVYMKNEFRLEVSGILDGCWDGDRMRQVVGNLLTNAVEHGTPGEPVTVRLAATQLDGKDTITIGVRNKGHVIDEKEVKKLFEPFVLENPNRINLGLGLFIVEQIVHAHHGVVAIRPVSDGTLIEVIIPRWNEPCNLNPREHTAKPPVVVILSENSDSESAVQEQ